MDFVWVTSDDANAIQNTIVDAKGDLIGATAADTPARLAVGTNGQVLTADSTAATGLAWATPSAGSSNVAGKNVIINGAFDIWQRGTSIAVNAAAYTTDRWMGFRGVAGMTVSRQSTNDTTNLPFIQYCARVQRDSGNTSTSTLQFTSPIETSNVYRYTGQTITMSFYARAGANYSPTSSALGVFLSSGTGTDGNPISGYTGQANVISSSATLTTTWQRFTYTVTLGATVTQLAPYFVASVTGTAGANDWFEITGVQIEIGSTATAFSRNAATIQGELAACQRYYYRVTADRAFSVLASGFASSTTVARLTAPFPVTMRVQPTALEWSTLSLQDYTSSWPISDLGMGVDTSYGSKFQATGSAIVTSGLTQFRPYSLIATNSTSAYIGWSAEL